jgi:hypothetical protein
MENIARRPNAVSEMAAAIPNVFARVTMESRETVLMELSSLGEV